MLKSWEMLKSLCVNVCDEVVVGSDVDKSGDVVEDRGQLDEGVATDVDVGEVGAGCQF